MANILKFPERCEDAVDNGFLQDGSDILQFEAPNQTSTCAFSPPQEPDVLDYKDLQANNWSNQELANLFRVKRLLDAAGVPNEIERGITDEGDPWFLFCDAKGEVFIHLCRLNGLYLLDSPNIETPLRGPNFNTLIEEFTDRRTRIIEGLDQQGTGNSHGVVRLNRDGKVFIHPATMLAALVWTLFLDSKDLIMVLPTNNDDSVDEPDSSISLPERFNQDIHSAAAYDFSAAIGGADCGDADHIYISSLPAHTSNILTDFDEEKLNQNTYVIGLSIIAISLGFTSQINVSDIHERAMESFLGLLTNSSSNHERMENHRDARFDSDQIQDFDFNLADVFENFDLLHQYYADANDQTVANLSDSAKESHVDISSNTTNNITRDQESAASPMEMEDSAQSLVTSRDQQKPSPAENSSLEEKFVYKVGQVFQEQVLNIAKSHGSNMKEYIINDTKVISTFDVAEEKFLQSSNLIGTSKTKDETASNAHEREKFNEKSFEFIIHFVEENEDFELIVMGNETILFDLAVLDVAADDTLMMSWTLDNGDVISTVGLRSDYDTFDLIA